MKNSLRYWLHYHLAGLWCRIERVLWRLWRNFGARADWIDREDMPLTMAAAMIKAREVPYMPDEQCQDCGAIGAYDFMGDMLCARCAGVDWEQEQGE